MIIANPLFDTAFKQIVREPEVAKAMIETLLEKDVIDIVPSDSEHNITPMDDEDKRPKFLRVDYCAVVRNKDGTTQKILIEMQKATGADNILRFREYLAVAGYKPKTMAETPIPVVTVYFLGFTLKHVETPCLKVARQYIDMLSNTVLETKEKFVELLTHDSYIIQAPRININKEPKTRLEKILSVFEQKNFVDYQEETINYKYPINDNAVKKMADILHYIGTDPDERKMLEDEAYWNRFIYHTSGALVRKDDELAEKDRELAEKDRELAEAKQQTAEAKQLMTEATKQIVLNMHNAGLSNSDIAKFTKISEQEVDDILKQKH